MEKKYIEINIKKRKKYISKHFYNISVVKIIKASYYNILKLIFNTKINRFNILGTRIFIYLYNNNLKIHFFVINLP